MKILLDISTLGLGVLHPEWRGGGFRVDERLVEELAKRSECDISFCANYSGITWAAARQYLDAHPRLSARPLLGADSGGGQSLLRRILTSAYRATRKVFPRGPLPNTLRSAGQLLERGTHRTVADRPRGADIFHSTHFPLPPSAGRSPQRFLTIYDLRYRRFPELYDARSKEVGDAILQSVGPRDWVITSSEASRADLAAAGVTTTDRIFVVPLAADRERFRRCDDPSELRRVRTRYGIAAAPYILSLSSIDVRKNMDAAVRAFARLIRREPLDDLQLVIAGSPGSGSSRMAAALEETADVRSRILQIGFVDESDLAALYSGAIAFLYPSLYEGFGLPPLEAMQCGAPVITSNTSSLPEVVGEAGIMVAPDDLDAMSAAMRDVATSSGLREELSRKSLERAAHFTWERTVESVLSAYRSALQRDVSVRRR